MNTATMMMIGHGVQAGAKIAGGVSTRDAASYNAAGLERQAAEERAAAQRTALERRRDADRVISKQITLAAASGAGGGPSLIDIVGDTAAEGEYRAQAEMYGGEARARALKDKANLARWEGRNAYRGSILEGIGGLALGVGNYGLRYGTPTRTTPIGPWRTTVTYG